MPLTLPEPRVLPIVDVLAAGSLPSPSGERIGSSRQGRPILGYRIGDGEQRVSLIAGCHADEPVGPEMLGRLVTFLSRRRRRDPLLTRWSWLVVPQANPDGAERNAAWIRVRKTFGSGGAAFDLVAYLDGAIREPPGDDIEFGFPRTPGDVDARPENRAMASFLASGAPLSLHASFHGMAFAAGPWFLLEPRWIDRTGLLRRRLRQRVRALGYVAHDIDRRGEKGFVRIDEGFTTRPDSRAMAAHFEELGDEATATLFRPSSMELACSLGGDPLTFVSEMPLFLLPQECYRRGDPIRPAALGQLAQQRARGPSALRRAAVELGLRPMPIEDQMHLQLAFLDEALGALEDVR